jgi:hypothetical protein
MLKTLESKNIEDGNRGPPLLQVGGNACIDLIHNPRKQPAIQSFPQGILRVLSFKGFEFYGEGLTTSLDNPMDGGGEERSLFT